MTVTIRHVEDSKRKVVEVILSDGSDTAVFTLMKSGSITVSPVIKKVPTRRYTYTSIEELEQVVAALKHAAGQS